MLVNCSGGLFVGIEGYAGLAHSRRLPGATLDASKLFDFFSRAAPAAHWRCLVENVVQRPSRTAIFSAFDEMVRRVPPQQFGLFHFAGHAVATRTGLVLSAADFKASLPHETGLPLRRLFELVKEKSKPRAKFLFLLDCCRLGSSNAAQEDIPPNVCLVHGSPHGRPTFESRAGGIFTGAFFEALRSVGGMQGSTQARSCNALTVLNRTCEFLPHERYSNLEEPDFAGFRPEWLELPLVTEDYLDSSAGAYPEAHLNGTESSEESLIRFHTSIEQQLRLWLDVPSTAPLGVSLIRLDEELSLKVGLKPQGHLRATLLVERLLNGFPDCFESLALTWPSQMPLTLFDALHNPQWGSDRIQSPDGDLCLRWPNRAGGESTKGEAWISATDGVTSMEIRCVSREGSSLPLVYLLPSLPPFFDRARRLRCNSETST